MSDIIIIIILDNFFHFHYLPNYTLALNSFDITDNMNIDWLIDLLIYWLIDWLLIDWLIDVYHVLSWYTQLNSVNFWNFYSIGLFMYQHLKADFKNSDELWNNEHRFCS